VGQGRRDAGRLGLSLIGFLSAKFILPEMYGYVEREEAEIQAAVGA
jgi:hypothetical protein